MQVFLRVYVLTSCEDGGVKDHRTTQKDRQRVLGGLYQENQEMSFGKCESRRKWSEKLH